MGVLLRGTFSQTTPTAASQQSGACSALPVCARQLEAREAAVRDPLLLGRPESQHLS